jgi:hypothetical protein
MMRAVWLVARRRIPPRLTTNNEGHREPTGHYSLSREQKEAAPGGCTGEEAATARAQAKEELPPRPQPGHPEGEQQNKKSAEEQQPQHTAKPRQT